MAGSRRLTAFLVDDEQLAIERLQRLLVDSGRVEVLRTFTDPETALEALHGESPELLFLDIQMPGMTGFELLRELEDPPAVIFTTAYDRFALRAFEENSIDYLVKPIEPPRLETALDKAERLRGEQTAHLRLTLEKLAADLNPAAGAAYPERLPSKLGDKIVFVDLERVTHFYSQDKLTYAAAEKGFVVDMTLTELEAKLDPKRWARIHRGAMVQLKFVDELHAWFGGKMKLRLKDAARTELTVSRDRVKELRSRLGF